MESTILTGCRNPNRQRGISVEFTTAAALVHGLMEDRAERRLLNL